MQKDVSWFNFMSYDLHGMWDQNNQYTSAYLRGHTNLTEINQGFDLLWRNNINPKNMVMGMGFYGRIFTMTDAMCHTADCTFSTAGYAGDCSQTAGILYYSEITATNSLLDVQTYYNLVSTVKYNVDNGAPVCSQIGCTSVCGSNQFQLNINKYINANGDSPCYQGKHTLCCDNTGVLNRWFWTGRQGPDV